MMSKAEARKKSSVDLNNGKLLNDIEAIGKALYLDKTPSKGSSSSRHRLKTADKPNAALTESKSKHANDDSSTKDKKSFWSWKALKASFVRNRRFNCCFTLEVHTIEGLPVEFNGLCLCVHWKRRDGDVVTSPTKVVEGVAEFEGKLTHVCSVYGSRSGPHHSAKYEAKHFLLYAALHDNSGLDLGKHRVDLTRLLPLTLEELEDEKSSGIWTTTFKLQGKAKGAVMNVSFGYVVVGDVTPNNRNVLQLLDSKSTAKNSVKANQGDRKGSIRRSESFPANLKSPMKSHIVDDVKVLHEVPPVTISEFSSSVDMLYKKFDEEDLNSVVEDKREINVSVAETKPVKSFLNSSLDSVKGDNDNGDEHDDENTDFSVIEKEAESLKEKPEVDEDSAELVDEPIVSAPDIHVQNDLLEETDGRTDEASVHDCNSKDKDMCTKESLLQDLESVLSRVANLEKEGLDSPEANSESSDQENHVDVVSNEISGDIDDLTDCVADEFLDMLGIDDSPVAYSSEAEPESPRERLLREFQKEAEASGCSLFGFDINEEDIEGDDDDDYVATISGWEEYAEDDDLSPMGEPIYPKIRANDFMSTGEFEYPRIRASDVLPLEESEYPKIRAKVMEDLETQALMEEWGLDENAFQSSPPNNAAGFGSPIDLPPKEVIQLPPLGEGLGPFIQTKSGGFLRSMNPVLFKSAKSGGSLVMQVSKPVVVPAQLGTGVMEIMQHMASIGLEKLSTQANKLMPLEDISGMAMQQMSWEATTTGRQKLVQNETEAGLVVPDGKRMVGGGFGDNKSKKFSSSFVVDEPDSEYVSLEDLAPLAMDKIEALSVEGLRIQSGMSDEEALSNISSQCVEVSALEGKRVSSLGSMGVDGAAGLQLLDIKDSETGEVDGLMGLSLTLEEWMRLDSGEVDGDGQLSERTSKLLAAHHASCTDLNFLRKKGDKKQGKASGRRGGLLANNFTVALMVQLRDPLRNYESVGTPMLALIQVERVFIPPKPKIFGTVSETRACNDDDDDDLESSSKEDRNLETKEEKTPEQDLVPQYKISEVHVAGLKNEPGNKKLWGTAAQQQSGSRWLLANGMGKTNKLPTLKPKTVSKSSLSVSTTTSQPSGNLWNISSRFHGVGSKWK